MTKNEWQSAVDNVNADYGFAVDLHKWQDWLDFFSDDATYHVQSRENYDRKLPLALIRLDSKNMMKDRIYGLTDTIFHQPYYTRHIIGRAKILQFDHVHCQCASNYVVIRTKHQQTSQVFNAGYYLDTIELLDHEIKIKSRICVYDTEMVSNALIYPV
jgi:salicylate 5-hydroxylase small subunit